MATHGVILFLVANIYTRLKVLVKHLNYIIHVNISLSSCRFLPGSSGILRFYNPLMNCFRERS